MFPGHLQPGLYPVPVLWCQGTAESSNLLHFVLFEVVSLPWRLNQPEPQEALVLFMPRATQDSEAGRSPYFWCFHLISTEMKVHLKQLLRQALRVPTQKGHGETELLGSKTMQTDFYSRPHKSIRLPNEGSLQKHSTQTNKQTKNSPYTALLQDSV